MSDTERFPPLQDLPPVVAAIIEFLGDDNWWYLPTDEDFTDGKPKRFPGEQWEDITERELVKPLRAIICQHLGHRLISGRCGMRQHDYCEVCGVRREKIEAETMPRAMSDLQSRIDELKHLLNNVIAADDSASSEMLESALDHARDFLKDAKER